MKNSLMIFAVLLIAITGCASSMAGVAQTTLEPFQVFLKSTGDGGSATANSVVGLNSKYIAVSGHADLAVQVYAPTYPDGTSTLIWEYSFGPQDTHQAWEIVLFGDADQEFIQLVPRSWEAARPSLRHLPERPPMAVRTWRERQPSPVYRLKLDR